MIKPIIGIDEVGRGCWAGPLVVGVVLLKTVPEGLDDSKVLSRQKRSIICDAIKSASIICKTGWVWPDEIDEYGLTAATTLAIERALDHTHIDVPIIIDGSINYLPTRPGTSALIKADSLIPSVAAASIVAKVARDSYMLEQSLIFEDHGFGSHVGYGTAQHRQALSQHGLTVLHRLSVKPVRMYI